MTFLFGLLFSNILPITTIIVLNSKILMAIKQLGTRESEVLQKKLFDLHLCVVVIFLVCHPPRLAVIGRMCLTDPLEWSRLFLSPIMYIAHLATVTNSSIHFVIYCFLGSHFRSEVFAMMRQVKRRMSDAVDSTTMTSRDDSRGSALGK